MTELDRMLLRLRAGETDSALLVQVRALLMVDPRLPPELRDPPDLLSEPAEVAEALLAVLGHDDGWLSGLLSGALRVESGAPVESVRASAPSAEPLELVGAALRAALEIHERDVALPIAAAVRASAGDVALTVAAQGLPPIVEAVRASAGSVDLGVEVLVRLGLLPVPVQQAVAVEAGELDVAASIAGGAQPVADAVRAEAGELDRLLIACDLPPVAAAVRDRAGRVDVVASVVGPSELPIGVAIAHEAGTLDVAALVVPDTLPLAQAVRAEAGAIDLVDRIDAAVRQSALAPAPIPEPAAANAGRFWGWAGVALAAVAMLVIVIGRFAPLGGPVGALGLIDLPDFAMLDEVRVEDLSYGERANAAVIPFQDDAGNGVLVIWVEEETDV